MSCKHCWIKIPQTLYDEVEYPSGAKIKEIKACITCMHSELNELAKMESENVAILKLWCNEHELLLTADSYCDDHLTQMEYDDIQERKQLFENRRKNPLQS